MNKEEIVKLLMWLGDCYDMDDRENAEKCADSYISDNEPKALNIDFVSGCFSFAKHFKQNYEFHQYTNEGKETYITETGVIRTEDEVIEHWETYYR
tara:strand:- start:2876 stop:3163 length:288 start_codon:yes stop_codon:yes gene_type:complete